MLEERNINESVKNEGINFCFVEHLKIKFLIRAITKFLLAGTKQFVINLLTLEGKLLKYLKN